MTEKINKILSVENLKIYFSDSAKLLFPWDSSQTIKAVDGVNFDIYAGEKLKMTDWHWFDWMGRPGVVGSSDIGGGSAGSPRATNQEEIQYKIMVGDTTNLSDSEKLRFFHIGSI